MAISANAISQLTWSCWTYVSCDSTHDGQVVGSNDLLHLLDASQVTKHVSVGMSWVSDLLFEIKRICYRSPNRNDVARVDQSLGKLHGLGDGTTGDGLETKQNLSYHFAGKTIVIRQLTFSIK